jgi:hypothetical protein
MLLRGKGNKAPRSSEPDSAKSEDYFERSLDIARQQQAKAWELRAAVSMARLCAIRGSRSKHANCSHLSMVGLQKASTRSI